MCAIYNFLRRYLVWVVLGFGIFCGSPFVGAVTFNGQPYVPLAEFARASGFRIYSPKAGEDILMNKYNLRLVFDVNSAQAQVGGVNVRLSYPVAADHGDLLVSQMDIETALRPLIFSQRSTGKKITTICLDPGHGGKDTGNRVIGFLTHNEKTYTLALALELKRQLTVAGFHVIMTRTKDATVELPDRPALANRAGADLFVSLHFNATPVDKGEIEGPETYCITPIGAASSNAHGETGEFGSGIGPGPTDANRCEDKSMLLAYQVQKSLILNLHANDRGVKRARFAVLRDATMPSILIEGGFMTNPSEGKKIYSADYRKQMAAAIVKAILAYQKLTAPPARKPAKGG
ncbi:MAG TPA: N-acetylmuramoyl-L-alanine amidase [Verrucomicrobiae bacterium]|jgi:N-acetylmuramoyl-L-alanine amidase|nr:N-acetylmuramoyl-L-alanine amidase [Verrucomicrobiae bacterium]